MKIKENGNIIGEFIETRSSNISEIIELLGVNVLNVYFIEDSKIIEGVSKKLPYVNPSLNFNIQISIKGNNAKIGTPALLDSF